MVKYMNCRTTIGLFITFWATDFYLHKKRKYRKYGISLSSPEQDRTVNTRVRGCLLASNFPINGSKSAQSGDGVGAPETGLEPNSYLQLQTGQPS
jgi:hypothetical protein